MYALIQIMRQKESNIGLLSKIWHNLNKNVLIPI